MLLVVWIIPKTTKILERSGWQWFIYLFINGLSGLL